MRSVCLAVILLLSIQSASAEVSVGLASFIEKAEPNELAFLVGADPDCEITEQQLQEIVKGVFVRSRIKPLDTWIQGDVYLNVVVTCLEVPNNNPIYALNVHFGKVASGFLFLLYDQSFGMLGIGDSASIKQYVKESVENAITAYLEANFDLGD